MKATMARYPRVKLTAIQDDIDIMGPPDQVFGPVKEDADLKVTFFSAPAGGGLFKGPARRACPIVVCGQGGVSHPSCVGGGPEWWLRPPIMSWWCKSFSMSTGSRPYVTSPGVTGLGG